MNQEETDLLYGRVGMIVALSQMIEYNLAEVQAYQKVLSLFDKDGQVKREIFEKVSKEAEVLWEKSLNETLGQNIAQIKGAGIFKNNPKQIDELEAVLKERNYLVHQFFKEDVAKRSIEKDITSVLKRLLDDIERMNCLNEALIGQIKDLKKEYDSIG